jgi:hypothetical protein
MAHSRNAALNKFNELLIQETSSMRTAEIRDLEASDTRQWKTGELLTDTGLPVKRTLVSSR